MVSSEDKIVRYQDIKLEEKQVTGYVVNGKFYGNNEDVARYILCTHRPCMKCGKDAPKSRTTCDDCSQAYAVERWELSEKVPISEGELLFYSESLGEYMNEGEVADYCYDNSCNERGLLLYHCTREDPPQVDLCSLYENVTPEDFCVTDMWSLEIEEACDKLNALMAATPVDSYKPSKIAVSITDRGED